MSKSSRCSTCHGDMGFMYMMTRNGYQCIPCYNSIKSANKHLISQLPDIEDLPPFDGKYRTGVIATSESAAKMLVDMCYKATPTMSDWEN